jgi:hypothetical protein
MADSLKIDLLAILPALRPRLRVRENVCIRTEYFSSLAHQYMYTYGRQGGTRENA